MFIRSRKGEWNAPDPKHHLRYLSEEEAALQRLALLSPLTDEEKTELAAARLEAATLRVDLNDLLSEYKDNEVRADGQFKGKLIRTTGIVGDVKKDILDDVYITLGTGQMFEIPVVQCFVKKDQVTRAAGLSKGDKVTVRGKVNGLMMNVLVKECDILQQ